ncbi:glycosyltransferase family 2 protein [uncultured Marivirga sp.]|uniref:glycosyltransferase family 2 protein n=1 Tax=uncultured Marivirga sp. TaxID=1123707 RepID=UPI0030EDCF6C|tara:strand:+ start:40888 stop:41685 length:798 start_codon:yes stop_codon:yes gene_type:complete
MISIILPFFNSEKYLKDAISSVLLQTVDHWELILVNDGSTDNSKSIALSFDDERIRYFEQQNKGVSSARNLGLANMKGNVFCFLDSDDMFTSNSLESRFRLLEDNKNLSFVDGVVLRKNENLTQTLHKWVPAFQGNPLRDLVKLTGKSFLGLTWMVRREPSIKYFFNEKLTHCEDLYFYMKIAGRNRQYSFTNDTILYYRSSANSAMGDLHGLGTGYKFIEKNLCDLRRVDLVSKLHFKFKYRKSMILAHLRKKQFRMALSYLIA